ncbi:MAG TPA: hypothetical protein VGQ30_01430 [Gemmatimonadaceae bacterium]|nr:hypothetical protein [Gemmatimonadaceae bacterium]
MFRAMLWSQWKWSRGFLLLVVIVGVTLSIFVMRGQISFDGVGVYSIPDLLDRSRAFGVMFQLDATAAGLVLAIAAWQQDSRTRHVYALLLPVSRVWYAATRFACGLILLLIPALALAASTAIAGWLAPLPPVLHVYAIGLAARWLLAASTVYAIIFALVSASPRLIKRAVLAAAVIIVADLIYGGLIDTTHHSLIGALMQSVFSRNGPYAPFLDGWMLIDV